MIPLAGMGDARGSLVVAQGTEHIPFTPVRFFVISDVPAGARRAEHAHHVLEELFVCLQGEVTVTLDDGTNREDFRLDHQDVALHKPPMLWVALHSFSEDAIVLVLASDIWRSDDHITSYDEFVRIARSKAR